MAAQYEYDFFNITFPAEYVAQVEINRPEKLNAFKEVRLSDDGSVRAIVLTAAGDRAFTAGLDVQQASQGGVLSKSGGDAARAAKSIRAHILEFQDCITAIERCTKPTICVLHGISYGLGIDLSAAADIRIACSDVRFSVKEVDIGIAADIGTLTRLPKVVGSFSWVKDVALTAREFGAEEAFRVGYVSKVVQGGRKEGVEEGLKLARLIASKSPVAIWSTKELLNYSRDSTVAEGLNYTASWNSMAIQTEDVKAALLSGIQKKKPSFAKL